MVIYVQIKHYLGNDRQLSQMMRSLGIPSLIWEPLRLLLHTVSTVSAPKHFDHA